MEMQKPHAPAQMRMKMECVRALKSPFFCSPLQQLNEASAGLAAVLGPKSSLPLDSHETLQKATVMGRTQK